jgi:hypothetical protein
MNALRTSYDVFDELITSLRADGLSEEADRLHDLIYKVAWTTGSELLGELGLVMKKLEQERGGGFSTPTRAKMDRALDMVARVWPRFLR